MVSSFFNLNLVSGDGDYRTLVYFLIEEDMFEMILFTNKKFASPLYKKIYSDNKNTTPVTSGISY